MTATPTEATDEQVADLERRFGRDGVVELTYQIALENLRSRMNSALGITEQGFNSADAWRVPWADGEATRKPDAGKFLGIRNVVGGPRRDHPTR